MFDYDLAQIDTFVAGYAANPRPADIPYYSDKLKRFLALPNIGEMDRKALQQRLGALEGLQRWRPPS